MKFSRNLVLISSLLSTSIICDADPSFDCKKATTATERAICGDSYVSLLDGLVANSYRKLIKRGVANIKVDQLNWLAERNKCGSDINCIKKQYGVRENELDLQLYKTEYKVGVEGQYVYLDSWPSGIHEGMFTTLEEDRDTCASFLSILNQKKLLNYYLCRVPSIPPFQTFNWQEIDIEKNKALIAKLMASKKLGKYTEQDTNRFINSGGFKLHVLETDEINGVKSKYYSISFNCDPTNTNSVATYNPSASLFFLSNADGSFQETGGLADPFELLKYKGDVFSYSLSRIHINQQFQDIDPEIEEIFLYKLKGNNFSTICHYQYKQ